MVRLVSPEIMSSEIIQGEHIISIIFLPEIQNMNIIMRKQRETQIEGYSSE